MDKKCHEINACEVCGNDSLVTVLNLGLHPMCDDLVPIGEKRVCTEYPIEILFCKQCITAHQRFQVPKHELFPKSYHYRSRFTADVLKGMSSLVESCEERFGKLVGKTILDIGCNDGSLLDFFRGKGAITLGIEPTGACADAEEKGHTTFSNYLTEDLADAIFSKHGSPDVITFTNVFAHIENLQEVIKSLNKLKKRETKIVIENHYLGSVLERNQFDTFYHEHPRTYSYTSFVHIARSLGLELEDVEFPARYGGNIRVFMGNGSNFTRSIVGSELDRREQLFYKDFNLLRKNIERWLQTKKTFLQGQFNEYGKLRAKAFPGRAAILIKMLDLDESLVSAVYEKPGSLKIGNYLPGTRIPIHSDEELLLLDKSLPILNLAWHIPDEIRNYLLKNGYDGPVIDILSADDFLAE